MKRSTIICKRLPKQTICILTALLLLSAGLSGCKGPFDGTELSGGTQPAASSSGAESAGFDLSQIPPWSGDPWVKVNNNRPFFTEEEIAAAFSETENAFGMNKRSARSFEEYGELDSLGRCTGAYACVGPDLMPAGERESISEIRPTGWHIVKYDGIDGNYLYNRCHLIAYGLTAENANERNLITGTRYMNTVGMNDFENETISYVRRTGRHVLYRVTPVFKGSDLVASGVLMEGLSIENIGPVPAVQFCVYAYNVQPGVTIDYATGESTGALFTGTENAGGQARQEYQEKSDAGFVEPAPDVTYVININSGKFHRPDCPSVRDMSRHSRRDVTDTRAELLARGFEPCGKCRP